MAVRGLQAYAVPSARAGQQPDPSARRDVLSGLLTAGFLLAVIAAIVLIILAAPEYAEPASGADGGARAIAGGAASPSPSSSAAPAAVSAPQPTSPEPEELKGYRWPVRNGGQIAQYYDWDDDGRFIIGGERVHAGIVITWFEGALVKAAHKGTVVYAGDRWEEAVGYDGSLDDVYARLERKGLKPALGVVVDDGNGYYSVYSGLQDLRVAKDDRVTPGTVVGEMSRTEGRQMMRYQLVRPDGDWLMKVAEQERDRGYPRYAWEHVDPLAVLKLDAPEQPKMTRRPPAHPPRRPEP